MQAILASEMKLERHEKYMEEKSHGNTNATELALPSSYRVLGSGLTPYLRYLLPGSCFKSRIVSKWKTISFMGKGKN